MTSIKQIIQKARIAIDDLIDINDLNNMTAKTFRQDSESLQAQTYNVQADLPQQG